MASPKQRILDHITDRLSEISQGNGYNTNITRIFSGKIMQTERFSEYERSALCQVRFVAQANEREGDQSGQFHFGAVATYIMQISMVNATHQMFMEFTDDIEATLAKQRNMELWDDRFDVQDSWVNSITIVQSTESDELSDTISPDIREQIAEIEFNVQYLYIPEILSGN